MKKLTLLIFCLTLLTGHILADIVIDAPKEGDKITMNFPFEIKWVPPAIPGEVKIRLLQNNSGVGGITLSTENDGSYSWKISQLTNGQTILPGDKYQLKIISINDANVTGLSGEFSLRKVILQKRPPLVQKKPAFELLTDLQVESITMSEYNPKYKTTFTINVKNNAGATNGPAEILVWLFKLNPDGSLPPTADKSWAGTVPETGNIGYQATVSFSVSRFGDMADGNWRVNAKVNPKQSIPETNFGNNQLSFDFTINN